MTFRPPPISDILVKVLSVLLAGSCAAFAGAMVLRLQTMKNPPADMGLNFPDPPKRHSTDKSVLVEPAATNSITKASANMAMPEDEPLQPYTLETPLKDFHLLAVINGIAFVELETLKGRRIIPVTAGATLPGAGRVDRIERVNGRWRVVVGQEVIIGETIQ